MLGQGRGQRQVEPVALNFERGGGGEKAVAAAVGEDVAGNGERDGGVGGEMGESGGEAEDVLLAPSDDEGDDEDGDRQGGDGGGGDDDEEKAEVTVSVSHVLTNVIVLQSFLFELASLVQVRAGLFDELRFA